MMKILFIGDLRKQARSFQRYSTLKSLGYEVTGVPREIDSESIVLKNISRVSNMIGYPLDIYHLNDRINDVIKDNVYFDIIWLDKPLSLKFNTLLHIKIKFPNAKVIFNTEDDMMKKHNQSKYFLDYIKLCDYVFTTKSYNLLPNEIPSLGVRNIHFFNNTFDLEFHRPIKLSTQDENKFASDVSFIGSYEIDRANILIFLAKNNIKIRVYGNGWESYAGKYDNLDIMSKPIYGDDYIKAICATKINLSFLRKSNRDLQTNRTMEIPACEAFMLTERTDEHLKLFREGLEAEFFSTQEELLKKIKYYLMNENKRNEIAKNARLRCINSGYDHKSTLQKMIKIISGVRTL